MLFADHRRLSGVYWAVSALDLLGARDRLDKEAIVNYVMSCYREEEGGFGGHVDQDAHILYTLSALQVLVMYDALNRVDVDAVSRFVGSLQLPDGSFMGSPTSPEVDTRFSYCAILSATLLNRRSVLDLSAAGAFLASCTNFDGGYGCIPDAESHAGQIFCVLAALALLGTPTPPAAAALCEWLASRQLPCGGLNGRPDKKEDVCYSWWVVASLSILGHVGWIDAAALQRFVLGCQDPDAGGVADRVGDLPDVFHTFFGLAALDLLPTTTKQEQTTQAAARVKKSTCRVRHHHTHPCTSGQPTNTKRKNRCAHKVATRPKRSWLPCPRLDRCRGRRDPTSKRRMRHQISSARTRCVLAPTPSQHFRSPSAL